MLPALWVTGLGTLLATGFFRAMLADGRTHHFAHWMENWLVAWPIAFPIGYLGIVPVARPTRSEQYSRKPGMGLADIEAASVRATVKNGLAVRHRRVRTFEVA